MTYTVTQEDREAAANNLLRRLIIQHGGEQPWMYDSTLAVRMGEQDNHWEVQAFARHRIEALERAAEVIDIHPFGGVIIAGANRALKGKSDDEA